MITLLHAHRAFTLWAYDATVYRLLRNPSTGHVTELQSYFTAGTNPTPDAQAPSADYYSPYHIS